MDGLNWNHTRQIRGDCLLSFPLDQPGFLEAEIGKAAVCGGSYDDVIEQANVQEPRPFLNFPGQTAVGFAWR